LEAWCTYANKNTHVQNNISSFAVQPKAARPEKQYVLENVWFCGRGTPGLQKTTWPTKAASEAKPFKQPSGAKPVKQTKRTALSPQIQNCREMALELVCLAGGATGAAGRAPSF
jgi:hypothetical protein